MQLDNYVPKEVVRVLKEEHGFSVEDWSYIATDHGRENGKVYKFLVRW